MTRMTTLVAIGLLFSFGAHADVKLGYIDMQKAIQETAAGKKAKKELEDAFNKKKKDLEKLEGDIKKKGEEFEKRSMAMNDEARAKKNAELQGEMRKYQELAQKSQMEIQKQERDLTQPIVVKIRTIMETIAKKDDYAIIFEKAENSVAYAKKELDLTDRIVKEYDKK